MEAMSFAVPLAVLFAYCFGGVPVAANDSSGSPGGDG
jgi:hypothetical protein